MNKKGLTQKILYKQRKRIKKIILKQVKKEDKFYFEVRICVPKLRNLGTNKDFRGGQMETPGFAGSRNEPTMLVYTCTVQAYQCSLLLTVSCVY